MAYTRVTRAAFGTSAIDYAIIGTGHNGKAERNEMVTMINLCGEIPIERQMERYWNKTRSNHKTQIIRVIQSFSKNELDPDNPADILKANEIGQAMVKEHYPHRQAIVCTQTDGKGGCVHNHILINDVSMKDNKGCKKEQYYQPVLIKWTDEIASRYTNLDTGSKKEYRLTQAERVKREKGEYIYKDDIRERVTEAMKKASSEEDFLQKLSENGVSAIKKNSPRYGECYTYELVDKSKIPEGAKLPKRANNELKIRSYKLGNAYGPEALRKHLGLYERVAVREEFTKIGEDSEVDIVPEVSLTSDRKEGYNEETDTSIQVIPPVIIVNENVHDDLRVVLMDCNEEEQETDILSEENGAVISKKLIATTAKPARRKKQRKKAMPDHKKRKAQLGVAINNGIIYNDGNDDPQCDKDNRQCD